MGGEVTCRWVSSDQPRVLSDRHRDECGDEGCRGCQPCPMDHCRVCGREHALVCGGCLGEVRENLAEIRRMCLSLVAEVRHRGVNSEAMVLLGPAADVEAREHWEASVLAGRILPPECDAHDLEDVRRWLDTADDERHPLLVLGTWAMTYRAAFEHDEPLNRVTVFSEAAYLTRNLSEAGAELWTPFEDMARDLRTCVAHMERVLHDGEQVDEGAPCLRCERRLVRVWGFGGKEDGWACPGCRESSTDTQYHFAMKAEYISKAEWLTDVDMAVRVPGITAATVRSWAATKGDRPVLIRKTLHSQRTVYSVEDVEWIYACTKAGGHAA